MIVDKDFLKELEKMRQNLLNNIEDTLNYQKLQTKTKEILLNLKKEIEKRDPINLVQKQYIYNPLLGINIFVEAIIYAKLITEYENSKEVSKEMIEKAKDINKNYELVKQIEKDFKFLNPEKIADFILQKEKKLEELREFQVELLKNLENAKEAVLQQQNELKEEILSVLSNLDSSVLKKLSDKEKATIALVNYFYENEDKINDKDLNDIYNTFKYTLSKEEFNNILKHQKELEEKLKKLDELNYDIEMSNYNYGSDGGTNYLLEKVDKVLQEIRDLTNLNLNNEIENNLDTAIQTLFEFDTAYTINAENVSIIKDYINYEFSTDLDLRDIKFIKDINQKIQEGTLEIDFENIIFDKQLLKDLATEKEKLRQKETELELA